MKKFSTLSMASIALATLPFLTSCQDEDFGYTEQEIKTSRFAKNFEAEYGPISPDQSWDLTQYMYRTSSYDNSMLDFLISGSLTRAQDGNGVIYKNPESGDLGYYENGYYVVQEQTIRWLRNYLKEGQNNTDLGKAFTMVAPENQFAIIPIYQGIADMSWSLHMKVNGVDTKIWEKSQDILVRDSDSEEWRTVGTTYGTSQTIYNRQIKSKPILIDFADATVKDFSLSLHIDEGKEHYATTGTDQTSSTGMMLALSCPIPTNVGTTNNQQNYAMVIGCEDANLENSDWDLNDVCFLIVGYPMIPDRVNMTSKRYMCEDLGNTYDFDFNDIVVDVTEIEREHYDPTQNKFVLTEGGTKQFATIKHLCGTIPFQVTIGDYTFPAVSDPTNHAQTLTELQSDGDSFRPVPANNGNGVGWNPDVVKQITGWSNENNNITLKVVKDGSTSVDVFNDKFGENLSVKEDNASEHIYTLNFPERGKAPLILATDQTTPWKAEHVHIDPAWWQNGEHRPTHKEQESDDSGQGGGSGGGSSVEIPESLVTVDEDGNAVIWEALADFEGWDSGSWGGMQVQTPFLDAVFEGYTILEIQFANTNTAHQFRFIKVRNDWENYFNAQITDGKFVHTFTGDIMSTDEYYLGFAMMMDESGGKLVPSKIIMRKPTYHSLTIGSAEHGSVTISGTANAEGKYAYGSTVTLTATPDDGWYFDQWSDGSKVNPRNLTINNDTELSVSFTDEAPSYLWKGNANCNDWSTNPTATLDFQGQTYEAGDKLVIIADKRDGANLNIAFNNWNYKADGAEGRPKPTETADGYELTLNQEMVNALNSNKTIIFNGINLTVYEVDLVKPVSYTLTIQSSDSEKGSVEFVGKTGASFTGHGNVQLKANPATGYKFVSWSTPTGSSNDNPLSVTLSESTAGTYIASFTQATRYTISVSAGDNGSIDTSGGEYYEGTSVTFTATPNEGYRVARWTKNTETIVGETKNTLTITINGNDVYGVEFEEKPAEPTETELTLADGHTLLISTLEAAGAEDNDNVRFYISTTESSREGWGIGGFANSDNWSPVVSWEGKAGQSWTYEYPVSRIKEVAGNNPGESHGIGITINIYNECKIDKVTLIKSN